MNQSFDIDCELNYAVQTPSTFIFKIEASRTVGQLITDESLTTIPPVPYERYTDWVGTRTLRMNVQPGELSVRYRATAHLQSMPVRPDAQETEVSQLPMDVLPWLNGSRYVESELIFPQALQWIGATDRGHARVERVCEWVRQNVTYEIGTSKPFGTTRDVLANRTGVCRDYAHVSIALCRALNIPARFVAGHVMWTEPPPDFHALFEAWLDGRWVLFDPTRMAETTDVIRIGVGYDAAELAFATIFGNAQMTRMAPLVTRSQQPW